MAFTLTLPPEIEQRLRARAQADRRSVHKTVELAIDEFLSRMEHREEIRQLARQVYEEDAEFYRMLGDR